MEKVKTFQFTTTPESLEFYSATISSSSSVVEMKLELIVGLRGVPYLVYLTCPDPSNGGNQNCFDFKEKRVSLNEKEWDMHVSLTPLALCISPDQKLLLVATDKQMHLIFTAGTSIRVRILTEHSCGDYGKPSVCWDHSGFLISL
jgi:hypothetical protein